MKKRNLLLTMVLFTMIGCGSGSSTDKKVDIGENLNKGSSSNLAKQGFEKQGKILYKKSTTYTMTLVTAPDYMLMIGEGTKRYVFDNYGKKILEEENEHTSTTIKMPDQPVHVVEKDKHDMHKTVNFISYNVNYEKSKIRKTDYSEAVGAFEQLAKSDAFLKKYKDSNLSVEAGTDTVLGYTCKVYKTPALGASTCFYKNIPLKMDIDFVSTTESGSSHMIISEVATSIDFDADVAESEFVLPNFPISEI